MSRKRPDIYFPLNMNTLLDPRNHLDIFRKILDRVIVISDKNQGFSLQTRCFFLIIITAESVVQFEYEN